MAYGTAVLPFSAARQGLGAKRVHFPIQRPWKTTIEPFLKVGQTVVDKEKGVRKQRTSVGLFICSLKKGTSLVESLDRFVLEVPKIPLNLLRIALADFRRTPDREAMVFFCYSKRSRSYYLKYPKYVAGRYGLTYRDPFAGEDEVIVLNLHSHHNLTIGANFSSVDDEDSFAPMIYGVAGNISSAPEFSFRAATEGVFKYLPLEDIFDVPPDDAA